MVLSLVFVIHPRRPTGARGEEEVKALIPFFSSPSPLVFGLARKLVSQVGPDGLEAEAWARTGRSGQITARPHCPQVEKYVEEDEAISSAGEILLIFECPRVSRATVV